MPSNNKREYNLLCLITGIKTTKHNWTYFLIPNEIITCVETLSYSYKNPPEYELIYMVEHYLYNEDDVTIYDDNIIGLNNHDCDYITRA